MDINIKEMFKKVYGKTDDINIYFAPGRVNLIGEHTDYNGGHVLPCAITIGTYAAVKMRDDDIVRFYSDNFKEMGIIERSISDLDYKKEDDWANFPKGIISIFGDENMNITRGFDVAYCGNIPNGAGLSSSASIEVLTAMILKSEYDFDIDNAGLARISRRTENEYIGVNCGIMDQFSIAMGRENNAILLNTSTMDFKYAKLDLKDNVIMISNTNKRRGLADSKYNERFSECKAVLEILREEVDINDLCDLDEARFKKYKGLIKNETLLKRARHVVTENVRTIKAFEALNKGDLNTFGVYMNDSHKSLKEDYEVTGTELDTLVDLAQRAEGVIGSRMTGAGFGGCTVTVINRNCVDEFIEKVGKEYKKLIGYEADFYMVSVGSGVKRQN